jgi:hypothetical protein
MATIAKTALTGSGSRVISETTLGASDTFTFSDGDVLLILNDAASPITPNILGDSATTVGVPGVGSVDVSGGYDVPSIAIGIEIAIPLTSISKYLTGTITLTGADGAIAKLLTV